MCPLRSRYTSEVHFAEAPISPLTSKDRWSYRGKYHTKSKQITSKSVSLCAENRLDVWWSLGEHTMYEANKIYCRDNITKHLKRQQTQPGLSGFTHHVYRLSAEESQRLGDRFDGDPVDAAELIWGKTTGPERVICIGNQGRQVLP